MEKPYRPEAGAVDFRLSKFLPPFGSEGGLAATGPCLFSLVWQPPPLPLEASRRARTTLTLAKSFPHGGSRELCSSVSRGLQPQWALTLLSGKSRTILFLSDRNCTT